MVFKVFISSTREDLEDYREQARDAALKAGFLPVMFEHWPAAGHRTPVAACLQMVAECDLVLVIVAHRFGWIPPDQPDAEARSITWLECEHAMLLGKEVIALVVDDAAAWPVEQKEEYAAIRALDQGIPAPETMREIYNRVQRLRAFKAWLNSGRVRATFRAPADLRAEAVAALNDWQIRHRGAAAPGIAGGANPDRYLRYLWEITRFIDIRGLQSGSGRAHQFAIEDLYIPVKLKGIPALRAAGLRHVEEQQIQSLLTMRRAVLVGDPGSGKTTLLRRLAHTLAESRLRIRTDAASIQFGIDGEPPLPLFIRLSDLAIFVVRRIEANASDAPATPDSPDWLVRFFTEAAHANRWGLDESFYRDRLEQGGCIVLMDGFDEAPSTQSRKLLAALVDACAHAFDQCQFVVTSRPKGYTAETSMSSFERVDIEPLDDISVRTFLGRWCEALFPGAAETAAKHRGELEDALSSRIEIRRMATNPVMLTALAVVHWNENQIPDQRSELYESIITWLSRARALRPGRIPADRCVRMLQAIALAMQDHPEGRQVEVPRRWAADVLVDKGVIAGDGQMAALDCADDFLAQEELDSGIVVARGNNLRFWHLSFQEFLAGRALAALTEHEQQQQVLASRQKLISSEWREMLLLFAGILHRHGEAKVRAMLDAVLMHVSGDSLADDAQMVGVIGSMLQDLTPLGFRFEHPAYTRILERVEAVFDADAGESISLETRLEAADALGQAGDPRLRREEWAVFGPSIVWLGVQRETPDAPGYDPAALPHDGPPREERIDTFRLGRFQVTVGDYARFIDDGGYRNEALWIPGSFGRWSAPEQWELQVRYLNRPVVGVTWFEASAYCRWRGERFRLPHEIEWDRAARGVDGRWFPWGNAPPNPQLLNFAKTSIGRVAPVGLFPLGASPEGVLDLAGNVFEWCTNAFDPAASDDNRAPRVVRGGGYRSVTLFVRSAFRGRYPPDTRADFIGFRLCQSGGAQSPMFVGSKP